MTEVILESPQSIIDILAFVPPRHSGEMLNDDDLDRLCDAVLDDLSAHWR